MAKLVVFFSVYYSQYSAIKGVYFSFALSIGANNLTEKEMGSPRSYKTCFMLISNEHKMYPANQS